MKAALLALVLAAAAPAAGPPPVGLTLWAPRIGWVSAHVTGPPRATVALREDGPAGPEALRSVRLGPRGAIDVVRLTPWRCDRSDRRVTATLTLPDGTMQTATGALRTPGCGDRLTLAVHPARPRAGRPATVEVGDRWGVGEVGARLCVAPPGTRRAGCSDVALPSGAASAQVRLRPDDLGRWRLSLHGPAGDVRRAALVVRPASRRLRVLAAGDSMIQLVDGELARRLGGLGPIAVRSDAHVSSGISKPFLLDWERHAQATAAGVHPDATVLFLGANDGFPLRSAAGRDVACCGDAWVHQYARRARSMMRAYARSGHGLVFWLLLPAPRDPRFAAVFGPVNRAVVEAARALPGAVRVVDLGATFTPGGRFRTTMPWDGRTVTVRQPDGVHLTSAGAGIAAGVVIGAMRADGLLG